MSFALDPERAGPEDCACKIVTHAQTATLPQKSLSGVRSLLSAFLASLAAQSRIDLVVPLIFRTKMFGIALTP